MARFFQEEIGQDKGDQPKKKKNKAGNQAQETQGDETGFVHALTPKQKAEYDSLDKNQKEIVKYVLGVPGVDVSKIDLCGNKRKESTPPLPSERIVAHSGSGRSLGLDAGGGTKTATGNGGTRKPRYEDSFLKETSSSADRGTGFTRRSGSVAPEGSGGRPKINTNGVIYYLQSLKDEDRRKSANPALVGALAAGIRGSLILIPIRNQ